MKRIPISKALILILSFLVLLSIFLLSALPKSLLLDRFLTKRGISLIPEKVEEDLLGVSFRNVKIFVRNDPLAMFDILELKLRPIGLSLSARCGEGSLEGHFSFWGSISLRMRSLRCLESVDLLEGDLMLGGEGLFGRVSVQGLGLRGFRVDKLNLDFKGSRFEGAVESGGMRLEGGGTFRLRLDRLEDSEVNALFKGKIGSLSIKGRLKSPSVQMR